MREAIGLAFDFEWTNKNIMYSAYKRVVSFFPNTPMEAKGKPGPDELKLLEPFRDKLPASVFGEPYTPPESDGSGFDRKLLKQAYDLLDRRRLPARRQRHEAAGRQAADHRVPRFLERAPAAHHAVHPEPRQARHPGQHPHRRRGAVQGAHRRLRLRRGHGRERRLARRPARNSRSPSPRRRRRGRARATSPASPIRSSTRWSRRSPTPSRARS